MKRIFVSKLAGLLGVVALATLLNAGAASAQNCGGKFTLTSETRWGAAILPPGHYTFQLDSTDYHIIVKSRDFVTSVIMMPQSHATDTRLMSSELILVSRGRKPTVRELRLASIKEIFSYAVPKEKPEQVAEAPSVAQPVPVTINGK